MEPSSETSFLPVRTGTILSGRRTVPTSYRSGNEYKRNTDRTLNPTTSISGPIVLFVGDLPLRKTSFPSPCPVVPGVVTGRSPLPTLISGPYASTDLSSPQISRDPRIWKQTPPPVLLGSLHRHTKGRRGIEILVSREERRTPGLPTGELRKEDLGRGESVRRENGCPTHKLTMLSSRHQAPYLFSPNDVSSHLLSGPFLVQPSPFVEVNEAPPGLPSWVNRPGPGERVARGRPQSRRRRVPEFRPRAPETHGKMDGVTRGRVGLETE